jgi:HEAT repeat protein
VSANQLLIIASVTNLALIVGLSLGGAFFKVRKDRENRHRETELAQIRPVLMSYLASWEDGDARVLADVLIRHRSTKATFEELIAGLLPKLRGADRSALVDILRRRGTIEQACKRTGSHRPLQRDLAVELLGAAGTSEGAPYVAKLLHDRNRSVRLAAVRALGRIGGPEAAVALIEHLDESGARIPPHPITMALLRIGADATEPLLGALENGSVGVQTIAAEVLGVLGLIPATGPLERRLATDPDPGVRVACARALGRLGMPSSVPGLVHALQNERHVEVLATVATALGQMAAHEAIPTLERAVADPEPAVRTASAAALLQMGEPGIALLRSIAQRNAPGSDAAREVLTYDAITAGIDPELFTAMPGGRP